MLRPPLQLVHVCILQELKCSTINMDELQIRIEKEKCGKENKMLF